MDNKQSKLTEKATSENKNSTAGKAEGSSISIPQISLPKGGGAIKSIDDKFSVNAANGTAGFSVPFPFSPSRNAFMPGIALSYDSGSGNGIFGLGWNAEPTSIARKTERKLPQYKDNEGSDTFIFSGMEDLVPSYIKDNNSNWIKDESADGSIKRYKPRIEGSFARIEKITEQNGNIYWKVTSKENIVSIFGKSKSAQVFDPNNESNIFKWLFEFSYDDKGNCYQFEYIKENKINVLNEVHEKNRLNDLSKCTNVYLKRIKYCNKIHFRRAIINFDDWENFLGNIEYLLELVLDYGEHDLANPQPNDDNGWLCRQDAFSDYRAGFEIRTWRLCKRILMFHHFIELGQQPCLVRSLNIEYDSGPSFTFLKSITQKGFIRKTDGTYTEKSLPPVEFTYEQLGWDTTVKTLPKESLENLPVGIDDQTYQWIDLYSEGLSGILTEQANGLYYKSNSGDGKFDSVKLVSPSPSLNGLSTGAVHFQDIEANGQKHLVSNDLNGFFEFTPDDEWLSFKNFNEVPNIDLRDPNVKLLDLNGDGKADILISEEDIFVWYESKGKEGFENYKTARKTFDEEKGPNIVFADSTQSIVLADMSGDGLTDIVRIRNNDISYWPNLGYGRFGAKVSMSSAPEFDLPDHFNPQYLKLADLDGSGTTGIVYLAKDSFKIYFNQSGNSWSEENIVQGVNPIPFPKIDDHSNVNIIDLLGNGTGCIVWSSPLPQHAANPLRYIDLMAGRKPHIMVSYKNNMGKEVSIEYKPSTTFYLEDKKAGKPWVTKLPFPVQCVSKVIVVDQIRKARFTNQYKYHHGYYDYKEREFRGFGRVDQTDTEDFENYKKFANPDGSIQLVDERFHMPPMLSKTWFHTGAFLDNEKILDQFAHEYYQNEIVPEKKLQEPVLPSDWTTDEWREALRACKGMPLHAEVYSLDGSVKENHPYTTAQHTCFIQRRQPILKNKNAIFLVSESEAITYSYERNPADPRIAHSMNLEVDEFGNVLKAAAISYGRKTVDGDLTEPEQAKQSKTHIIFSENSTTNKINTAEDYHLPVLFETSTYELTGITPLFGHYYTINDVNTAFEQAIAIDYQTLSTPLTKQRRLIEQVRSVFKKNDQSGPLPPGVIESLALPWQSYKLSLTPALMDSIFGNKVSDDLLLNEGKYVHFDDDNYWIPSGTQTLDAAHFYQVTEMTDPFGYKTKIIYDTAYHLFVQSATDALNNVSSIAGYNFRTLTPYLAMDINDNRSGLRTDELGMVTSTFIIGKEGESKGDFLDESSIEASANDHPGTVFEYELFNYINNGKSNFTKGTLRETHHFENIESGQPVIWQTVYVYVCGAGNPAMIKTQAEPGLALQENADGTFTEVDTTPNIRWVGNGRTIFNNKGNPVKQYEPYFSTTFEFEDAKELVERGVTPVIYYDSAGRVIQTDLPNGTFTKVAFDAWKHQTFDPNDTVLESQWYRDRILVPVPAIGTAEEITAANKAAAHAKTPAIVYIDSLGRTFLSIADNGLAGKYKIVTETDIEGNVRKITDQRGNTVIQYKYNMLGDTLYQHSMDSGERWTINDVMGKLLMSWDAREHIFRTEYDVLHRPVKNFLQTGANLEITINKIVYGEGMANDKQLNLRGKAYQVFDTAGIVTNRVVDFKGNTLQSSRQLCREYTNTINWDTNPALAAEIFISATEFDALNRMVISTLPDSSIVTPTYNEANLLNKVEVQIRGATQITVFVKDINYDVKGQRESILYGNDTKTTYAYDPKTYRLTKLITTGKNGTSLLQQLHYTYDPVGNITFLNDEAQQTIFFNNNAVTPSCDYVYDAVYRLITATGREHIGQNQPVSPYDEFRTSLPMPGDAMAMRNYTQQYEYDAVGNIIQMIHAAGTGSWTRTYHYEAANNRLKNHTVSGIPENLLYDSHGNILSLAHLPVLTWDFRDQLQQINLGGGGTVYYVYDAAGQRIRKVIERQDGTKEERLYLNGVELFRKTTSRGTLQSAIETLNIMDSTRCIAIVETQTVKDGVELQTPVSLTRYQYSNHLGSSSFELDETATIISYEEYHPYGTTSYQAMNADIRAAAKRYRYTGMERDEESGLEYHGARYYLPWLGRWLSADPIGVTAGINFYAYCRGQPTIRTDQKGTDDEDPLQWSGSKEEMVERHARLMDLLIKLDGPIYQRKSVIANYLKKHGDDDVLEHYGYKSPGFFTKQITFQKDVVKALKTYDYGFRKLQGQAAANMNATDAAGLVAAQKDKANWEAGREGYSHVTSSLIAGASASAARLFTDDPIKIAAAAGLGASFSGIFNAYASTYVDRANQPVLSQSQPTISLNLEALEGTSGMGPRNTFRPRSPAVQQSTDYTCVATSCKMVLDDLGWRGISEDRIAAVLNTTPEGAKMWDVPQAIRQLDIPVSRNNLIQDVAFNLAGTMTNVEKALNSGNKVIASMRQGLGYHAVVVDTVTATNVAVRDPDIGATVVMSRSDFENRFTGRMVQFVLKKK